GRRRRRPQRLVLRADESVSLSGAGLHVRCRLHDSRAPDPRLGAARRPESASPRSARQGGRTQSAHPGVRALLWAQRVVLRVGSGRRPGPRRQGEVIEQQFGRSLTVGVEEELWIIDAETLQLVPAVKTLVTGAEGRKLPGTLKTELHASVVELTTDVSDTP